MSDFFNSSVVRDTIMELAEMQHKLVLQMSTLPIMSVEQKKESPPRNESISRETKTFFLSHESDSKTKR